MITLHHLNNSRSQRILWLLEELGLDYQIIYYQRDPETMLAPESLKAIHPLGKSPVITDGNLVLAESGAIIDYLSKTYGEGQWVPKEGTPEALRYNYWLHYGEGSVMPPLLVRFIFDKLESSPMPFFAKPIAKAICDKVRKLFIGPQIGLHRDYIEAELAKNPWFVGDHLTGADIQMSYPLEALALPDKQHKNYPKISAWLKKVHERPAYQRALEKGGEFKFT